MGAATLGNSPAQAAATLRDEEALYTALVRRLGINLG